MNSKVFLLSSMGDMEDEFLMEANEYSSKMKKHTRPMRVALIAAAVAVLLAGTVLAATYKLWSPGLASWFGADEAAQEAMLESGMTSLTGNPSVTMENGLTLTLEQVFCDSVETCVVVRYDTPEDGWFTWENRGMATMNSFPVLTIGGTDFSDTGGGFESTSVGDKTAYMIWRFEGDTTSLSGQPATLRIIPSGDLRATAEEMHLDPEETEVLLNDPLILSTEISFSWTLELGDIISKTLEGSFVGEYEGVSFSFRDVVLTPISIRFTAEGWEEAETLLYPIGLVLADGTFVEFNSGHLGEVDAVPEGYVQETWPGYYTFDTTIMDLDSIAAFAFADWSNPPVGLETGDMTVYTLSLK